MDVSGIDLIVPAHGFYNRDFERLLFGRCPLLSNWKVMCRRGCRVGRIGRRDGVMERRVLCIARGVRGFPPWIDETFVV